MSNFATLGSTVFAQKWNVFQKSGFWVPHPMGGRGGSISKILLLVILLQLDQLCSYSGWSVEIVGMKKFGTLRPCPYRDLTPKKKLPVDLTCYNAKFGCSAAMPSRGELSTENFAFLELEDASLLGRGPKLNQF